MVDNQDEILSSFREQLKDSEQTLKNLSNFADVIYKDLPENQRKQIDKDLKKINISDISNTLADITNELDNFRKNFKS